MRNLSFFFLSEDLSRSFSSWAIQPSLVLAYVSPISNLSSVIFKKKNLGVDNWFSIASSSDSNYSQTTREGCKDYR